MACKRPGVRVPLAPPGQRDKFENLDITYSRKVHPWGLCRSRDGLVWPGDLGVVYRAWGVVFVRLFPVAVSLRLPRGRGPAGAPAAAQRRGRTSWRPGQRRPMMGAGEELFRDWFPGCVWWAEWSHMHLCGAVPAVAGCHDRDIG